MVNISVSVNWGGEILLFVKLRIYTAINTNENRTQYTYTVHIAQCNEQNVYTHKYGFIKIEKKIKRVEIQSIEKFSSDFTSNTK